MINLDTISLLKIARDAKLLCDLDNLIPVLKRQYHLALDEWKDENGYRYVTRDTEQWEDMLIFAEPEWLKYQKARQDRRNALRRLKTSTKKVNL